jgi:hypothetical protein
MQGNFWQREYQSVGLVSTDYDMSYMNPDR